MIEKRLKEFLTKNDIYRNNEISYCVSKDKVVTLNGNVKKWQEVVDLGHQVAKIKGVRNVVNNILSEGVTLHKPDYSKEISEVKKSGNVENCDVVIIGAGVSGCAIARPLSKYDLNVIVLEKNADIGEEATKANNGNIHPGFLASPGSLKAKLNLRGNKLYTEWANQLDFTLKRPGSLIVYYDQKNHKKFQVLKMLRKTGLGLLIKKYRQYTKTPKVKWLNQDEVHALEPNIKGTPLGGLWLQTMGIVEPFEVVYALSENAIENGVVFKMNSRVLDIEKNEDSVSKVITNTSVINCKTVINCAGVYADDIAEMVDDKFYTIHPRRGAIAIIDKNRKGFISRPSGSVTGKKSNKNSKGGGASVTPEGNLLWGPTAVENPDKENKAVEPSDLPFILGLGAGVTDEVNKSEIITTFAGVRAPDYREDFIIEASRKVKGLFM